MGRIKNMGTATMKFGEGVIVTGSAGSDTHSLVVTGTIAVIGDAYVDNIVLGFGDGDGKTITSGDDNLYIRFVDNTTAQFFAGKNVLELKEVSSHHNVTINETGQPDVDFRVETDNLTHALFCDSGNEIITLMSDAEKTLGTDVNLFVSGTINSSGTGNRGTSVFGGDVVISGSTTILDTLHVGQYIRRAGDSDTHLNFTDDKINVKAGGQSLFTIDKSGAAPYEITVNDDHINADFVVKGQPGASEGNPLFMCDASEGRVGINGVGTPNYTLDVDGIINGRNDLYVTGSLYVVDTAGLYADKIRRHSDSDNTTKILLNDELLKFYAGHSTDNICAIGNTADVGTDNNFFISGSIDSKGTATQGTTVFGGDVVISGSLYSKHRHVRIDKFSKTGNANSFYVKAEGTGNQSSPGSTTWWIPPAEGRLISAHLRANNVCGSTKITLVTTNAGDNPARSSDDTHHNDIETQTVDCSSAKTNYAFNFTEAAIYTAEQAILLRISGSSQPGDGIITTVWEYNFVS